MKSKFANKRKLAVDKVRQARRDIDDYLDGIEATAIADIDRNIREGVNIMDEHVNVCSSSLSYLITSSSDIDRIMSVGNKEEKFIAISRATKQINKYCSMLLEMYKELSEMTVEFKPNVAFSDVFQSLGTVSVETAMVTKVFTDTKPIYTGEMKVKSVGDTFVEMFDILSDGRKLIVQDNANIQLYDMKNELITETILPVKEREQCFSLLIDVSTEDVVVSTNCDRLLKVRFGDESVIREIPLNEKVTVLTKCSENVLGIVYDRVHFPLCVIDKNMEKIIKTILKDDGTLFSAPFGISISADRNTIYVLDSYKGCYAITVDGQIMFHYQNPAATHYFGLVI